ncbi:MAG: hypothetical protein ACTSP4_15885, partial [Candidatus Hodarchaeales archaeon]
MVDKKLQDAITYKQDIFRVISDKESLGLFKDANLSHLLTYLRKGPMTVKDLEKAFKEANNEKADKTIYRYLNILEKENLVVQGGKRLLSGKGGKIKTQTLYMRTAKVFLVDYSQVESDCTEKIDDKQEKITNIIGLLVSKHLGFDNFSTEKLSSLMCKLYARESKILEELLLKASDEVTELMNDLDFSMVQTLIKKASYLALLAEKDDWQEEIAG